jgi:multicomponent Na+:H+ antiporter subunit D
MPPPAIRRALMSSALLALPVAGPLLAAALLVALPGRSVLHRTAALGVSAGVLVLGVLLLAQTRGGLVLTQRLGGWLPGIAIGFAADSFSALMLCATTLLVLVCLSFAMAAGADANPLFTPLALILSAGVYGAFLTADLFNLFVFVEVMLVPSYALFTLLAARQRVVAARLYLAVNLLASTMLLAGIGLLYGVGGTVNLAELAGLGRDSPAVALAAAMVLLAVAVKAAVVPLHGWLPRTYPDASPAVTALFSGLLTKVGVYAIIRIYAVVYAGDRRHLWLILTAALLTMVVGVLGAVGEQAMRPILVFHMVSQIGYILLGLALFTPLGLAAAIFYLVQYLLVKAALLICAGAVVDSYGTDRLDQLGGLAAREPLLALSFAVAALSLAGLPPMSGFPAKLALVWAAGAAAEYLAVTVAVVVGVLTLLSMIKVWNGVFWGPPRVPPAPDTAGPARTRPALVAPALVLAVLSIALGVCAAPLLAVAEVAAAGLVDTSAYVRAVLAR